VDAKAWVAKGASETFAAQLQSSKDQARTVAEQAKKLAQNPEKLSTCLELYFRVQALEQMIGSLAEGTRKYQDAELADTLTSLSAENGANRNRLESYIVNLAAECAVMDQEAQRCRGFLASRPPANSNGGKKK